MSENENIQSARVLGDDELDAVSGAFASLGLAGDVARYTVKMWLLDYQIAGYDAAITAAKAH